MVGGICRGSMCLSSAVAYANDSKSFVVSSGRDTFHLKANSADERDMWVKAIAAETNKVVMSDVTDGNLFVTLEILFPLNPGVNPL